MKTVIVDASVAAKWFFPEEGSKAAIRLLDGKHNLLAPDLLRSEFGNITWKIAKRKTISADQAKEIVTQFLSMPVEFCDSESILPLAMNIALDTQCTVYDCMYIALAFKHEAQCITADQRLVNSLASTSLKKHVRLL